MLHRLCNLSTTNSFFLFGARATGKSTLVQKHLKDRKYIYINLLRHDERIAFSENPDSLESRITNDEEWIFIDEIQKVPGLLDTAHRLIEEKKIKFALTGSSSRKLKAGGANLLAGRAFVHELFPLTSIELGKDFNILNTIQWGMLPKLLDFNNNEDKKSYLDAYALTYLQEEIWEEHLVRNLLPFKKFLQVAAQSNGKVVNYSNIASDVRVDTKTVQQYFQILEETLLSFSLEPYNVSLRKRQRNNPKVYLVDIGIWRALALNYALEVSTNSLGFGNWFEHFLISEIRALSRYKKNNYQFYFYRVNDRIEVDLVIERPHLPLALVEIKSHTNIEEQHVAVLSNVAKDYPEADIFCLSQDKTDKKFGRIRALPWEKGLLELGVL